MKTFAIVFTYLTDIPDVAINKDEYIVIAGGIITLECTVTSFPEVDDVVWLRNTSGSTEQIKADGIKFSGSNSTSPSLTISSADLADSGMYTCTATNVAGTGISIPAELYVSGGNYISLLQVFELFLPIIYTFRVLLVEQELLILPGAPRSTPGF